MTKRPNIVIFFTDDHARWALPCYGGDAFNAPNLDELARSGIVMEQAYTTTPVCSPARASFMTGLLPSQHGVRDFLSSQPEFHERDWLAGINTLPEMLVEVGYHCGLSGKWHLGRDHIPARGFDYWHAMSGAYPIFHVGDHEFSIGGDVKMRPGVLTEVITDGALDFLHRRPKNKPFFLQVGYYATHSPWSGHASQYMPDDNNIAVFSDEELPKPYKKLNVELPDATPERAQMARQQYRAAVAEIDHGVGQILDLLPPDEDTIVIYTSDHGLSLGQNGLFGKGNATYPQNLFDDNIRVPMILSRPGIWPEDMRLDSFCDHTDLHALLRDAAGLPKSYTDYIKRPGHSPIDGNNKNFQICEYGPAVRYLDATSSEEWRYGEAEPSALVRDVLLEYYSDLDTRPPWEWVTPEKPTFNPTDAWLPPE